MPEFKKFPKIPNIKKLQMSITQKLHGTNASVHIYPKEDGELDLVCGSRNRWVTPNDDNFGFATFVHEHKQEFIDKLGEGLHMGEWCGPGVNSGEGLKSKWFLLFDWWRWRPTYGEHVPLPPKTGVVPLLYWGELCDGQIDIQMARLKDQGSKLSPGFMRPEGIVVMIGDQRFKKVFIPEETEWTKGEPNKIPKRLKNMVDYSHLLQPIRLEKLISSDEIYMKEYPKSLGSIAKAYTHDLIEEGEITGDSDEIKLITKGAAGQIFKFIRQHIEG